MTDEKYMFIQDSKEKKNVAASARYTRTHCGKSGCNLPSDFMTRKELKNMNGECKTYNLTKPMTWEEFKAMPDDLKVEYIKWIRETFNAPDKGIADAMGINHHVFGNWMRTLGIGRGKAAGASSKMWWYSPDRDRFLAWWNKEEEKEKAPVEEPVADVVEEEQVQVDIPVIDVEREDWKPMAWDAFKTLTDDRKIEYINWIREEFDVPDAAIKEMFGVCKSTVYLEFKRLCLCKESRERVGDRYWRRQPGYVRFKNWLEGGTEWTCSDISVPEEPEIIVGETACAHKLAETEDDSLFKAHAEKLDAIADAMIEHRKTPCKLAGDCVQKRIHDAGPIAYAGNSIPVIPASGSMTFRGNRAEDVMTTLTTILSGGRLNLTVTWEFYPEGETESK